MRAASRKAFALPTFIILNGSRESIRAIHTIPFWRSFSAMARNSKLPTTLDREITVCARCRSLLERPQVVPKYMDTIPSDISNIAGSASNGCKICKRLLIALDACFVSSWRNDPLELSLCFMDLQAIARPPDTPQIFDPMITLELSSRFKPQIIEEGVMKGRTPCVGLCPGDLFERSADDTTSMAKSLISQNTRDSKCLQQVHDWITNFH
jgi:hypothetical protein